MTELPLTLEHAEQVAAILEQHHKILEIQLFGSISRTGMGKDLDLIIIAGKDEASRFICATKRRLGEQRQIDRALQHLEDLAPITSEEHNPGIRCRAEAAEEILGMRFTKLIGRAYEQICLDCSWVKYKIDFFVLWPQWQENIGELNLLLPQENPKFWENVARDAYTISFKRLQQLDLL